MTRTLVSRSFRLLGAALVVGVGVAASTGVVAAQLDGGPRGTLVVDVRDLRSDGGSVRCSLYASRDGYPTEASRAVARAEGRPHARQARCTFENVAPGSYAVSVHHDEDGDGVFDTGIFGIPLEGVGASRDAHGTMGPPSFEDARIDVPAGETRIVVHVTHAL